MDPVEGIGPGGESPPGLFHGPGRGRFECRQESPLAFGDSLLRLLEGEPGSTIDLWKFLPPSGAGRPLHGEGVAPDRIRVVVPWNRPRFDDFPARLPERAERDVRPVRGIESGLLSKLPLRCIEGIFFRSDFSFGDRPCSEVFPGPVGAARVDQEYLTRAVANPIDQ